MGRVIMKLHVPREEHLESICWKERGRTIIFSLIVREAIAEMQKKQEQERKEFMKPVITPSGEDYLEAVLILQKKQGMVRSIDLARHMEVSKPSVCYAVGTLREGGFLTTDENHYLHLTDLGQEVAEKIYERHCFLTKQLISIGVDPETAEADACRIEHDISAETYERLKELVTKE